MKIAIIGSGIAGLTAAHVLGSNHQVTIFESEDRLGMGAFSVTVKVGEKQFLIDLYVISFITRTPYISEVGVTNTPLLSQCKYIMSCLYVDVQPTARIF